MMKNSPHSLDHELEMLELRLLENLWTLESGLQKNLRLTEELQERVQTIQSLLSEHFLTSTTN